MKIIDLVKLLRKHLVLLLFTPILLAGLVIYLTKTPSFTFSSETTLYTGIASGSSVEMGKSLSYFATNTDFDNLINVINSRETQQEVAIRLLAQHLMLPNYDPRYISSKSFQYVRKITPKYIYSLIVKPNPKTVSITYKTIPGTQNSAAQTKNQHNSEYQEHTVKDNETLYSISRQYGVSVDQIKEINGLINNNILKGQILLVSNQSGSNSNKVIKDTPGTIGQSDSTATFSFSKLNTLSQDTRTGPASIDPEAFEQTVKNLTDLAKSGDTNFVYNLLNYNSPHYSLNEISNINVQRIANSDLVKLKYTSDDPGICQQTLIFFTEVCIKNYRNIKENSSDAVVKYFEFQVNQATQKLKTGEEKLLSFNKDNSIINYYEQSKAVAGAKEALDVDYNNMRIKLAGTEATIKRLEEKLAKQQKIQLESAPILEKRNQLSQINTKIATAETIGYGNTVDGQNLAVLKAKADELKEDIRKAVSELYSYTNSTEAIPINSLLNDWITNVLSYEDTRAGLGVLENRIQEFQKQYEIYAPAGANLKKIEREISVSEQEYLELLHGLNLAKLKMQDIELSSNLKSIDQPFYPLTPNPTKRKFLVVAAALFGFLIVLSTILALEFFDETLKNPKRAAKILNLLPLGVFPKIYLKPRALNFPYIIQRLIELIVQRIELLKKTKSRISNAYQILVFSTSNKEGKTVIAQNLASQLKKLGNKVILIRYSQEKTLHQKSVQNYCPGAMISTEKQKPRPKGFSLINWLFGYPDTRIDYQSPLLCEYGSTIPQDEYYEYEINEYYHRTKDYKELLINNNYSLSFIPDYVIIEIPPVLFYPYPSDLVASIDLPLMVCRANRVWSEADQGAVENIAKITTCAPLFVLNGIELDVVESILGELPKKRSWLRPKMKEVFYFQYF
ncbi:MAG: LysM peptidoglycan-binding domain-containing protein [Bacteroidia bacterium]|nr:LysM peptidoglycan-binding domain-containing protein [Bacteroidia bacterium]